MFGWKRLSVHQGSGASPCLFEWLVLHVSLVRLVATSPMWDQHWWLQVTGGGNERLPWGYHQILGEVDVLGGEFGVGVLDLMQAWRDVVGLNRFLRRSRVAACVLWATYVSLGRSAPSTPGKINRCSGLQEVNSLFVIYRVWPKNDGRPGVGRFATSGGRDRAFGLALAQRVMTW